MVLGKHKISDWMVVSWLQKGGTLPCWIWPQPWAISILKNIYWICLKLMNNEHKSLIWSIFILIKYLCVTYEGTNIFTRLCQFFERIVKHKSNPLPCMFAEFIPGIEGSKGCNWNQTSSFIELNGNLKFGLKESICVTNLSRILPLFDMVWRFDKVHQCFD